MEQTANQGALPERPVIRVPLTTNQHILHLILTLVTFGLWGIVWVVRAVQGTKVWADTQPGWQWGPWPYTGYRQPTQPPQQYGGYGTYQR